MTSIPIRGDRRRARIGLLGGSFNPMHEGHLHVARTALRRLRLDAVWLLVSPGNPLKPVAGMAPFAERVAGVAAAVDGRRLVATGIEAHLRTRYTYDTLRELCRKFPRVRFVWLMGADNLEQLPRWNRWVGLAATVAFAVLPRPTYNHRALAGQAAQRLRPARLAAHKAAALAACAPPRWLFLPARQYTTSATAIRAGRQVPFRPEPVRILPSGA